MINKEDVYIERIGISLLGYFCVAAGLMVLAYSFYALMHGLYLYLALGVAIVVGMLFLEKKRYSNKKKQLERIKILSRMLRKQFPVLKEFDKDKHESIEVFTAKGYSVEAVMFEAYKRAYFNKADAVVVNFAEDRQAYGVKSAITTLIKYKD